MNNSIIDTLSVTFPLTYFKTFVSGARVSYAKTAFPGKPQYLLDSMGPEASVDDIKSRFDCDLVADFLSEWLFDMLGVDVVITPLWRSGRNYFKNCFNFEGGFIAWGGNNRVFNQFGEVELRPERVQVYFDAEGCKKYINSDSCARLCGRLTKHGGRISRLDVAFDLMDGQISIDSVEQAYYAGDFSGNGRPPKCVRIEEKTMGKKTAGDTLYVGTRQSGKYLRAYEKGKQLGEVDSNWVRVEVELNTNNKRVIPPEALINPDSVFNEAYQYCADLLTAFADAVSLASDKIVTVTKRSAEISLKSLLRHCQRSYGTLIYHLKGVERVVEGGEIVQGYSDSEIVETLLRIGRPARLSFA